MRVCIINEFFYPDNTGGTGTVLSELARRIKDKYEDVELDVITSANLYRKSTPLQSHQDWDGISIFRIHTPHPNGLPMLRRLAANLMFCLAAFANLLPRKRYDVVLIGTAPPMIAWAASAYKALTGTPFVYIIYDLEPDRSVALRMTSPKSRAVRLFQAAQMKWLNAACRVVVLGRCMKKYVMDRYGLAEEKTATISTGSDVTQIIPASKATRFRDKHNLSGFIVLYSGNFGRYHNFDTVLDAAKHLAARRPEVHFALVGDGHQRKHIRERIERERIENVRLFDFVDLDEYPDLLASADVSLVTLEPGMEGLCVPSKFFNIMASGRPTIGLISEHSEIAMIMNEARCGVQVDQGDAIGLVDAIVRLASSPDDVARLGENARAEVMRRYSTELVAERFYELFVAISAPPVAPSRKPDGIANGVFHAAPPERIVRERAKVPEHRDDIIVSK